MGAIKILKDQYAEDLRRKIGDNLLKYKHGDFKEETDSPSLTIELKGTEFVEEEFNKLDHSRSGKAQGLIDAKNAICIHNALKGLTPYDARDNRLWVYLAHASGLEYARKRWAERVNYRDEDSYAGNIKKHFFCTSNRSFISHHAFSRLWWQAHICSSYDKIDLETSTKILLDKTDVRATILERPNSFSEPRIFEVTMDILVEKYAEQQEQFFVRKGGQAVYREWVKLINREGGITLLATLPKKELKKRFSDLAETAQQSLP